MLGYRPCPAKALAQSLRRNHDSRHCLWRKFEDNAAMLNSTGTAHNRSAVEIARTVDNYACAGPTSVTLAGEAIQYGLRPLT
jgi:hypothetical protein